MLLDADAQGSSQDWAESQGQRRFNFEVQRAGDAGRLLQEVRRLAADYDWATGKGDWRPTMTGPPGKAVAPPGPAGGKGDN